MGDYPRMGAPGAPPESHLTRLWRIVADVREPGTIPIIPTVPFARLLQEFREGSIPDDGSKCYQGPPIGWSWQIIVHDDGYKEDIGDVGGARGKFGEFACKKGCRRCNTLRAYDRAAAFRTASFPSTHAQDSSLTPSNMLWQFGQPLLRTPLVHPVFRSSPPPQAATTSVGHCLDSLSSALPSCAVPGNDSPSPVNHLNASAPEFDEKAYWKAREARARAVIQASKVPTAPRAKAPGSRISNTGTVFGARSVDLRPAAARRNDRKNRAGLVLPSKSPASSSSGRHAPSRFASPASTSTSTAASHGRRDTVLSSDEHGFPALPSPL